MQGFVFLQEPAAMSFPCLDHVIRSSCGSNSAENDALLGYCYDCSNDHGSCAGSSHIQPEEESPDQKCTFNRL